MGRAEAADGREIVCPGANGARADGVAAVRVADRDSYVVVGVVLEQQRGAVESLAGRAGRVGVSERQTAPPGAAGRLLEFERGVGVGVVVVGEE